MAIMGFELPPESNEKVSMGMMVLLSSTMFMSRLSGMTPTTSETTPLIGSFFAMTMWLTAMTMVFSMYILMLHHNDGMYQMKGFVRFMATALSPF